MEGQKDKCEPGIFLFIRKKFRFELNTDNFEKNDALENFFLLPRCLARSREVVVTRKLLMWNKSLVSLPSFF